MREPAGTCTSSTAKSLGQLVFFVPVLGGDVVEGDLSVGDGDEALEDGRLEVGEDEAAGVLVLAVAARDVAHHGRQGAEQQTRFSLIEAKIEGKE